MCKFKKKELDVIYKFGLEKTYDILEWGLGFFHVTHSITLDFF